jgi:hypothetical protein
LLSCSSIIGTIKLNFIGCGSVTAAAFKFENKLKVAIALLPQLLILKKKKKIGRGLK